MGPTRTAKPRKSGQSSKSHRAHLGNEPTVAQPGVQKLKASLRQTRRLLAKENLAADVRVETERRLRALEADLARGELAKKERGLAIRYHKIKFFERQKVVRKLNQAKKRLASTLQDDSGDSAKKDIGDTITELRIDLNYILHYPKTKKYISLFPPEVRHADPDTSIPNTKTSESTATATDREEVRTWIRTRMQSGELEREPEMHLDSDSKGSNQTRARYGKDRYMGDDWDSGKGGVKAGTKTRKGRVDVDVDAFFGDDNDEEDIDEDEDEDGETED